MHSDNWSFNDEYLKLKLDINKLAHWWKILVKLQEEANQIFTKIEKS